jgi:hypothetical protein
MFDTTSSTFMIQHHTGKMRNKNDWKEILADDLVSSPLTLAQHQHEGSDVDEEKEGSSKTDNSSSDAIEQCRERAFDHLTRIEEYDVPNKTVISIINGLQRHFREGLNHNKSDAIDKDDQDFFLQPIVEFLSSSTEEACKVSIIQFVNLLLSNFSLDDSTSLNQAEVVYKATLFQNDEEKMAVLKTISDAFGDNVVMSCFWQYILHIISSKKELKEVESNSNDIQRRDSSDAEVIIAAGDYAAEKIYGGAQFLSNGLTHIIPKVTSCIENAGEYAKQNIEPNSNQEPVDATKDEDRTVAITQTSVRATDMFRESAKTVAGGICDYSTKGINKMAEKWDENKLGKELCPEDELRETIVAAGKIGMATLGATLNIAESVFDATKAIAQTTTAVTAQVAQHKFGGNTGAIIENTGTATGNVIRGITHVGTLEGHVLSKVVMKKTAKAKMDKIVNEKSKDEGDETKLN